MGNTGPPTNLSADLSAPATLRDISIFLPSRKILLRLISAISRIRKLVNMADKIRAENDRNIPLF